MTKHVPEGSQIVMRDTGSLIDYARNPRQNDHAVDKTAAAIREFGFRVPILAQSDGLIIDGHLRLKAAKKLGMEQVPVVYCDDMTEGQKKAFRISVNKIADLADWDDELLKIELEELDEKLLGVIGFDADELNLIFKGWESDVELPALKDKDSNESKIVIKVVNSQYEFAKEVLSNALDGAGIDYEYS